MDPRISLLQRPKLQLSGHVYVGDRQRDEWKSSLARAVHGLVESYHHDYEQRLECPICREEKTAPEVRA